MSNSSSIEILEKQGGDIMRYVLLICIMAFAVGCSSQKSTAIAIPTAAKVALPRDDCPNGFVALANAHGVACWPADTSQPTDHCRPERCPATGYMLWNCPEPTVPGALIETNMDTGDNVESEHDIRRRCFGLLHEFGMQRTVLGYEAFRSCLRELQTRVKESERQQIDEMLRGYDARARDIGWVPAESQ